MWCVCTCAKWGTVELLTREGEISIAKRIEEGTYQVLTSLAHYPEAVQLVLEDYDRIPLEEIRLNEIINGFADSEEEAPASNIGSMLDDTQQVEFDEEPLVIEDDEEGGEGAIAGLSVADEGPNPEQAKVYFDALREDYESAIQSLRKEGRTNRKTIKLLDKMSDSFLKLKWTSRQVDKLTQHFRQLRTDIREFERRIMRLAIEKAHIPRKLFVENISWPRNKFIMADYNHH